MPKLSSRNDAVKPSPTLAITARANAMRAQGADVVGFGAGEPDFETPAHISDAAVAALRAGFTRYTPEAGIPELRIAIAARASRDLGLTFTRDNVAVTVGGKQGIYEFFLAALEPGDEVLIPTPCWVSYPDQVTIAGGKPVFVEGTAERGFVPSSTQLAAAVTPRTRALVICSPSNPTGAVWTEADLGAAAELAREHDLWILSDEIYSELVYEGRHRSVLHVAPGAASRVCVASGASKTYAMTGWRVGWVVAPPALAKAIAVYTGHTVSAPTSFAQKGAVAALTGSQDDIPKWRSTFRQRRDRIVELCGAIPGCKPFVPTGAFYLWVDVREVLGRGAPGLGTSDELAARLLENAKVALVPGSAFCAEGFVRLSFATSMERIEEGCRRIRKFVEGI
ncbi:MAG: pyridoxal phosphate-dependent aminotransferase [Deltaproteobacteria bacterium]|nr:pyridoxal phosphate-dependent aminotransferase [Deltaproteobacteria bacterium]